MRIVMNPWRWLATTAVLVLGLVSWYGTSAGVAPEPLPSGRITPTLAVQGAGSCSATACHGGTSPAAPDTYPSRKPILRNEHTTWITQDRHADAYRVLFFRRSREMATRLNQGKAPAHEDARCLACHATSLTVPTSSAGVVRSDGVSCESCHGAAERWLGAHTQGWWGGLPESEKFARFGMRPTRALEVRAKLCVECHVGSPGRDVNHDLIAAGHPRLSFEFAAFLANMPPHWVEETGGNFPARAWAVGQAATARAAADLLARRAGEADRGRAPWPEFSEYDCFACHHDLADETWRQARAAQGRTLGAPAWGTWYYPQAVTLARHSGHAAPPGLEPAFAALQAEMGRFGSDPARVAGAAQGFSDALGRWLQTLPGEARGYDPAKIKSLVAAVRTENPPGPVLEWDSAAQRYLALQPLHLALKELDPASIDRSLESELQNLFKSLQYPPGYDSPRRYQPVLPAGNR
jgi:hypothetical protein